MNTPHAPQRPSILIHGATGRMGQSLLRLAGERDDLEVVAAVSPTIEQRVVDGIPRFRASELTGVPKFDVAIDFSRSEGFDGVLSLCATRGAALVSGTTALTDAQEAAMDAAATHVPILWASNFSLGVAVLASLVQRAAHALPGWDCDIVEAHHTRKLDAPSGTALTLGSIAGKQGASPRYASLRAGDIVGEHTVQFTTDGERIELIHRATNRDIFARGALAAAVWLSGRQAGRYALEDLFD